MKKWLAALALVFGLSQPTMSQEVIPDIVETISIKGTINENMVYFMSKKVDEVNANDRIKAVILMVDSGGGGVVSTWILHNELSSLRVPVVAWCEYVCASGAMYILMNPAVDYIAIRPGTITGSIGVISQVTRYSRLLEWLKIDYEVYRSGRYKDLGNPMREAQPEEKKRLTELVDNLATKFYIKVAKHRTITDWDAIKSAKIFFGEEGVRVGLADAVLSKQEVIAKAKELSGSSNIYTREEMKKISKIANSDSPMYYNGRNKTYHDSLLWFQDFVDDIRNGELVKFEYRMPYDLR